MPIVADIADAVFHELADAKLSLPFKAVRAFRHDQTLPEGKELRVAIVPKGVQVTPAARAVCNHVVEIYIAVAKKVDRATAQEMDPLLALVEEIVDFFRLRRLERYPDAIWTGTEVKPMVSSEHVEKLKQFTSLITTSFKVCR